MKVRKYVKIPVEIEAIQFNGSTFNIDEVERFVGDNLIQDESDDGLYYRIATLEGHSYRLDQGDYIIKGVHGEFYPCKPDIFAETYEMVMNAIDKSEMKIETGYKCKDEFMLIQEEKKILISLLNTEQQETLWLYGNIYKDTKGRIDTIKSIKHKINQWLIKDE